MKNQIKRAAVETQGAFVREPAPAGSAAETQGWVSVSSEMPVMSAVRCAAFEHLGLRANVAATPDNPNPRQAAYVVLSHDAGAILGDWVKDGIVIRDGHYGDTCARLMPAYLRDHKLGGDKLVWSASERAKVLMRDVESGVRRDISVEGDWDDKDLVLVGEIEGVPLIRATRWTPLAAAIVDVRADPKVGVARSSDATAEAQPQPTTKTDETNDAAPALTAPTVVRSKTMTPEEIAAQQKAADAARAKKTAEIFTLAREFNVPNEVAIEHIMQDKPLSDFQSLVIRDFKAAKDASDAKRQTQKLSDVKRDRANVSDNVPAEKLAQFSILRALMGQAKALKPDIDLPKFDDGLEREVSQEAVRLIRSTPEGETYVPRGICIPWDGIMRNRNASGFSREFTISGGGTGSNIVAQNLLAGQYIDYLRAKLVLQGLGMTVLPGLVGDVLIPKQTGTATSGWQSETTNVDDSIMTASQIKLTPHTLNAISLISRRLMLQSSPAADMLVMNDIIGSMARSLQSGGLHGTGANNQPVGLFNALANGYQGFAAIAEATVAVDGAPTYAELEEMMGTVDEANIDSEGKWLLRPKAFRYFKSVGRVGTTGFVPAATGNPYQNGVLADAQAACTTGMTTKYAAYGSFDSMVLGMWGALDVTLDPWFLSARGGLRVIGLQDVDFGYRYLPAFGWSSKFKAS